VSDHNILINRAPVLTLWATTVSERLGFDQDKALTLGKAVAGLNAQSKDRRLGIFKPVPQEIKKARARKRGEEFSIEICGRSVSAVNTPDGVRAAAKALGESTSKELKVVKKHVMSAAARARIGRATKKRWAKIRRQARKVAG
jgi:hypothetical protein